MVTTIQLNERVKEMLSKLKTKRNETYEEVIIKLVDDMRENKMRQDELLKEGYLKMAKDIKQMNKEWSKADAKWD